MSTNLRHEVAGVAGRHAGLSLTAPGLPSTLIPDNPAPAAPLAATHRGPAPRTSVTTQPAPDSTHGHSAPAPLSGIESALPSGRPTGPATPAWPEGWAGLLALLALLALVAGSTLWLATPTPAGLARSPLWPAVLSTTGAALLALGAGLLMRRLRLARAEVEAAHARIHMLVAHDELTGLWNRRHAQEAFQVELQRATRSKRPLCLALVDIDNLKQINDHQGH
ncbi:MAG: hypothetical protein RL375_2583, partial [Pseudomonadota bacterium]